MLPAASRPSSWASPPATTARVVTTELCCGAFLTNKPEESESMRSHLRVLPREQLEESICELADRYPKCFFVYGRLRLPLKIGIETDLRQDGVDEATVSAVEFYRGDWGYLE